LPPQTLTIVRDKFSPNREMPQQKRGKALSS
jgi:hypothetical protein